MITACDVFLFVLSPDSVTSQPYRDEATLAASLGKRLVPVSFRDHGDDNLVPEPLREPQWTFIRTATDFQQSVAEPNIAIHTDYELAREHRRLLIAADNWDRHQRRRAYLLRGEAVHLAETWLVAAGANPRQFPRPTALQSSFIVESQRSRRREVRTVITGISAVGLILGIVAIHAWLQRDAQSLTNARLGSKGPRPSRMQTRQSGRESSRLTDRRKPRWKLESPLHVN
jgi:hypothetical protein